MLGIPIYQSGLRGGEFIVGIGKQNKGTILELRGEINQLVYPPSLAGIANLSKTDLTHKFRLIDFFSEMSPKARLEWLEENSTTNNDLYMSDVGFPNKTRQIEIELPEIEARIIKVSGAFMTEHYSEVPTEEWFTIKELEEMVPLKPGSKGLKGHSTLVFRPGNWELLVEEQKTEWEGLYINLDVTSDTGLTKAALEEGKVKVKKGKKLVVFEDDNNSAPDFAIIYTPRKEAYTWEELFELVPEEYREEMTIAKELLTRFTASPAFFKSLLQKIIRYRAKKCVFLLTKDECDKLTDRDINEDFRYRTGKDECGEIEYTCALNAQATLLATVAHLIMHPGAFVPNIQRFVSGRESAFKRVAVSICEDSWTKKKKSLLALYCGAALAQREKNFIPSTELVVTLFTLAVEAQQEGSCFIWQLGQEYEYEAIDDLSACAMVLEHVKSFLSDIQMVKFIASTEGKKNPKYLMNGTMEEMFIYSAIDHHTNPEVAYFFPYEDYQELLYPELFKLLWDVSSGFNPRKRKFKHSNELADIRVAQKLCLFAKFYNTAKIERGIGSSHNGQGLGSVSSYEGDDEGSEDYMLSYQIDKSWLAGLIGPLQIKNAYVVLRTDDLASFTAIKKPSRTDKVPELTDDEKEEVIDTARETLSVGLKLTNCPPCLDMFANKKVKFDAEEETYSVLMKKKWVEWEECINLQTNLKKHEQIDRDLYKTFKDAILTTGEGVEEYGLDWFDELISDLEPFILRRLSTILNGMATTVMLPKIGRSGDSIDYTVYNFDTEVFRVLCKMCNLFPAALEMTGTSFTIKNGPLFWKLRDLITKKIAELTEVSTIEWKIKKDKRKLWEYQQDVLTTMKTRTTEGKRGNLIWMEMGTGKSMITTEYIRWLIREQLIPSYVVWTLPSSAIDSISKEVQMAGLKCKVLDCRKNQDQTLVEGVVCIVRHDHLRLNGFDERMREIAANCLFIVDEFHKTMAKGTQRTSITLDLVKLSQNFIGLSGTILKDTKGIDDLIQWLQTVSEFEVNSHNYYVAIGSLISRKVPAKVSIDRETIEVEMDEAYYALVPTSLGGTASVINFKNALEMSYTAMTEELITQAKKYLKAGEKIFLVARNVENQKYIASKLKKYNVFLIDNKNQITLGPDDETDIDCVITTVRHCEGYTLSLIHIMLTGVYFSNQNTRSQLEGRINRQNQENDITIITVNAGILSYIYERYENTRNLSEALKGFAKVIGLEKGELRNIF